MQVTAEEQVALLTKPVSKKKTSITSGPAQQNAITSVQQQESWGDPTFENTDGDDQVTELLEALEDGEAAARNLQKHIEDDRHVVSNVCVWCRKAKGTIEHTQEGDFDGQSTTFRVHVCQACWDDRLMDTTNTETPEMDIDEHEDDTSTSMGNTGNGEPARTAAAPAPVPVPAPVPAAHDPGPVNHVKLGTDIVSIGDFVYTIGKTANEWKLGHIGRIKKFTSSQDEGVKFDAVLEHWAIAHDEDGDVPDTFAQSVDEDWDEPVSTDALGKAPVIGGPEEVETGLCRDVYVYIDVDVIKNTLAQGWGREHFTAASAPKKNAATKRKVGPAAGKTNPAKALKQPAPPANPATGTTSAKRKRSSEEPRVLWKSTRIQMSDDDDD